MSKLFILLLLVFSCAALADDARFCGVVYRDVETKEIVRSAAVKAAFKREWPCVTPCGPDWQVDHTIPLKNGGCDSVINMQWLPPSIKTCALPSAPGDPLCKDRFEMRVYGARAVRTVWMHKGVVVLP
ncbi:MAG: hypothetical protein A2V79_09295 [Betaproteobacteria bacterium RBG_16_56_24]|nr:MAG: hypothetical protein A2V79_09295 [Betaproteobacteria bacterium RBG_16_56_24]